MPAEEEDEQQSARKAKAIMQPVQPTPQEIQQHNLTHMPYRSWCPVCKQSRGRQTGNMTVRFAPAYSSQSSGSIERFHRTLAGHIRTLREQVQQTYNTRLPTTHPIMAWAVRRSAYLINRFLIRADGYTSYHTRWGRTHNAALCEFGEIVMYMVQSIKQRPKLGPRPRFYKGIWLGKCTSTGPSLASQAELYVHVQSGDLQVQTGTVLN